MSCDYKSDDPRLSIDPRLLEKEKRFLEAMYNREIQNCNDGLYIVNINNGKSRVFKIPEEDKALKDILVMFKSFINKIYER